MTSITAELKTLRQQVERLQAEAAGRKQLSSVITWNEQNADSVNTVSENFSGLVVHLTPDVPGNGDTTEGQKNLSQNEFNELKKQILGTLDSQTPHAVA